MTSDTTLRRSYAPRGVVLATAESLPEGPAFESAAARSLSANVSHGEVDVHTLSALQHEKEALALAMAGYIGWVREGRSEVLERSPAFREKTRTRLREELPGAHPRTPDAAAALLVGIEALRAYAASVGVDRSKVVDFHESAAAGLVEAAKAHAEATSGGDPASRFVELLRSLFAAGKVYVRHKDTGGQPPGWESLGWEDETDMTSSDMYRPRRHAEFVGWADGDHLYLDRETAFAAVSGFAQRGGIPFGIKPRALWDALKRAQISLADGGRSDTTARIEGRTRRVVQTPRVAVFGGGCGA
jgi:hypothetical protein